ncbi:unnamed protein product, partial [Mesorhabditis belari]|uniref:Serine/threonine-protein phosphatase n=1 Tax=Mesorhabditis belari TaxID=2138241 RepID=A0AAF3EF15_9BILA
MSSFKLDIDALIVELLTVGATKCNSIFERVSQDTVVALCAKAKKTFLSQSSLVEVEPPIRICGDTHGHYDDVLRLFDKGGFPPKFNYIFLGDYVDRGKQSLETILLLFCYKVKYSENFFLLRGNHECSAVNKDVFNVMPLVGLVGGRILCMHGGLSPRLESLDQLRTLKRPIDPPNPSLHIDLLWSDPDPYIQGWHTNSRGVSFAFGADVVKSICQRLGLDLIVRAHQVVEDGYEFFADRRLVTIFSCPYYCGLQSNKAAIMCIDENMKCSFLVLQPTYERLVEAAWRIKENSNLILPPKRVA